jgi:hypothetical protein
MDSSEIPNGETVPMLYEPLFVRLVRISRFVLSVTYRFYNA